MKQYKGHPIYGVAIPVPQCAWSSRGLIFDQDQSQTVRIKRIEGVAGLTFQTKHQAEDHGLTLCRNWIDEQAQPEVAPARADPKE